MRKRKGAFVRKRVKASFDPKVFLAKVGEGKTISKYQKDQIVFSQGQVADAVFTSSKARSSSLSFPSKARKRWLQSWDPATFSVKDV
jgi:CRP/FNR family transcriptional regulator, cyclic AMP receptor protein